MSKLAVANDHKRKIGSEKKEGQIKKLFSVVTGRLMDIYVLFYLCVFPLCMRDRYFDILSFRFGLYWKPTLAYGITFLAIGMLYLICDVLYNDGEIRRRFFLKIKNIKEEQEQTDKEKTKDNTKGKGKSCIGEKIRKYGELLHNNQIDIVFTVLIIIFSLSTLLAEYPYEAFWGDRGRYQGLLIWLMFYISYILITRFYRFKKWHLWAFMVSASVVCVWGICNFFMITFGMFVDAVDDKYQYLFVSSIGNINTYTNFTGILYGVSAAMFISSKRIIESIATFVVLVIVSFAQIMAISDNTVLSTGIVLALAPLFLWKNYGNITKYLVSAATYLGALKITSMITRSGIATMNDLDPSTQITIAGKETFSHILAAVVIIAAASVIVNLVYCIKNRTNTSLGETRENTSFIEKRIRKLRAIWAVAAAAGAASIILVLILANTGWKAEIWEPYRKILIFDEKWGTGRGLIWRLGMEYWEKDATLLMKLFGYGPDTFYIITMDRFVDIMKQAGYGMFDSAHNEYIEYFLTVGIFGLMAYISLLYVTLRRMLRNGNRSSLAIAMGVMAYACQAVINIAIPITTPVLFVLMFAGIVASYTHES